MTVTQLNQLHANTATSLFLHFKAGLSTDLGFLYMDKIMLSIQEEIKNRLKLGNVCYYSVRNHLFSILLSKTLKIKIYRTIIFPVVLYGCENWSLTLREERSAGV